METIIFCCGIYSMLMAVFHMFFWKLFNWNQDLKKLRFENRGILQILNVQIIVYFLTVAVICFWFSQELITTAIGKAFLLMNVIFWVVRTVQQYIFLCANHYIIHLLSLFFALGAVLFSLPLLM